ncbi:MAG: alpha-2-macroglobulin, partial [Casimicrobiaceae bacterium]
MARVATLRALRMLCLSGLIACCTAGAQSVTSFSPQGEVKAVRQVTARFATPMVAFGDPRGVAPFTIGCAVPGKGRWADPRNWVYDFDADLPAGVHCAFTLDSGVTDLAGKPLAAAPVYALSTGGPAILNSVPDEGDTIDEAQVFILGLDAPASPQSVLRNAWCEAAGINERIGVRIVTGAERRTILDARRAFIDRYLRVLLVDDSGRTRSLDFRLPAHGSDRQRFLTLRDAPDSPLVLLACARTLPAGAQMKLIWGKGIATTGGIVTTSEQPLAFTVRPAFRATFSCPRANKDAQCIPVLPMQLTFSARIRRSDATAIRLLDAAGNAYATKIDGSANTEWVDSLSFGPGYAEMQALRIELPPNLHDDAGRALVNARSFPLRVHTDQSPPIVKFPAKFGILESHAGKSGPLLPVTVRNVESPLAGKQQVVGAASATAPIAGRIARVEAGDEMKIVDWLGRIADNDSLDAEFDNVHERWIIRNTGPAKSLFKPSDAGKPVAVPRPLGRKAFEVVGIPVNAPGFYVVELASPRLGAALFGVARPWYARTSV